MATTYYADIQKLYVAYFNRPADTAGLAYWENVVEGLGGSTTAVSAAFSAEKEYMDAYAGMSNADIVDKVYQNLFGRAAEAAGKAYWADLMDQGAITVDKVVTAIAAGAQGADVTAYANKVTAAGAFTAALATPEQQHAYSGADANALAKAFMSGITDDVSLDAALSGSSLDTAIAKVVAAGTPFSLASAAEALHAAEAAHTALLDAADGQADGIVTLTDADIAAAVAASTVAVDALVSGGDFVHASAAVKAALLADAQAAVQQELVDANKAVASADASIGRISGLADAIAARASAIAAADAADAAAASAATGMQAQVDAYSLAHNVTITVRPDGAVDGLIAIDGSGHLVLAAGVTEATNPGVTALLDASVAQQAAIATDVAAIHAADNAVEVVNYLDMGAVEKADLQAMAAAMTTVHLPANALPTLAQIGAELSILSANANAAAQEVADANAGTGATQAQLDAASAASTAYNSFKALSDTYQQDYRTDARMEAAAAAHASLAAASADAAALDSAVAALNHANDLAAQLKTVNAAVDAANQVFSDHQVSLPQTADGAMAAGTGADIYLAGAGDASIAQFGQQGSDVLYIGSGYTLNADISKGSDSVLEAFIVQNGADVQIVLEDKASASNEATPEVVTITLTGVDATHVHLVNGLVTVS